MNKLLLAATLLLAFQTSDCAKAGSIQDESVTAAKREVDAVAEPTPSETFPGMEGNHGSLDGVKTGTLHRDSDGNWTQNYDDGTAEPVVVKRHSDGLVYVYRPKLPQRPGVVPEVAER